MKMVHFMVRKEGRQDPEWSSDYSFLIPLSGTVKLFLKKKIPGVNSAVQIGTVFAPGARDVIKSGTGDPESEQKREGKQAPCPDAPVTAIFILSALC